MKTKVNDGRHFRFFANCVPVRGHSRSIIMDLQNQSYFFIPNDMLEVFETLQEHSVEATISLYGEDNAETIIQYIQYIESNRLGFYIDNGVELNYFPKLSTVFQSFETIENCIIDFNKYSNHDLVKISSELEFLRCSFLQMRFFDPVDIQTLIKSLDVFDSTPIRGIEIVIPFADQLGIDLLRDISEKVRRVSKIVVHSCTETFINEIEPLVNTKQLHCILALTKSRIHDETHCGFINKAEFVVSPRTYAELLNFNGCLNKKISIAADGRIKKCPALSESFGFSNEASLIEVLEKDEFNKYDRIHKDMISVCKDCEFRYMCTDCRAFTVDPNDMYSKPAKCKYDPYNPTDNW